MWRKFLILAVTGGIVVGCYGVGRIYPIKKSYTVNYIPDTACVMEDINPTDFSIAIAGFSDEREIVDPEDPESNSRVTSSTFDLIALTYDGQEFTPVSDIVQGLLVDEFRHCEFQARPFHSGDDFDYLVTGSVIEFWYYHEVGFVSTRYIKSVIFELTLSDRHGQRLFVRRRIEAVDDKKDQRGPATDPHQLQILIDKPFRLAARSTVVEVAEAIRLQTSQ